MNEAFIFSAIVAGISVSFGYLIFFYSGAYRRQKREILVERQESSRRLYELAILKELGERVGYSLNVEEILQIITGSLKQFIDYTAVGYVVINPEKLKIYTHIDRSVGKIFLKSMKESMMGSISALTDKDYSTFIVDEVISGALVIDEMEEGIGSLFNIPLVIGGIVVGVLTVAHTKQGLYAEEDMTILYKITNQASEAVNRLQEVVKVEQGKLNAMVESMGDGVVMIDPEYKIVVANPAIKNLLKFEKDKVINIFDFVDVLGGKFDIRGRLEEAMVKKVSYISERLSIEESFFEIGVYPVSYSFSKKGDQVIGAVVVFHDITRDIELERIREEFTSMIVHELRSPLDGIKKITELMVSGKIEPGSGQFKEYVNMTHQSSSTMLELVNDILDLSKLEAGKFEINKEISNIKEVIENRISFYKISATSRNVNLEQNIEENIPEEANFDSQAVKQILNNLISNALKFTSSGGNVTVSSFVLSQEGNIGESFFHAIDKQKIPIFPKREDISVKSKSICIVVSDTGIGIPKEGINELFHTFKQAKLNPVDKESKGTGLGLVIVKGIVEAHGGKVGLVSEEGSGTSFFFTIPL
jgi:signal transduction histidine kinase